jgi:hemerythrin
MGAEIMIEWNESFSSGIEEVDNQHKELIKLIQRLKITQEKRLPKEFVLRILQETAKYSEYHFISEENLMLVTKYPDFKRHESEHKKLLHSLAYKIKSYQDDLEPLASLITFLTNWFTSHTREEDAKIGVYLEVQHMKSGGPT